MNYANCNDIDIANCDDSQFEIDDEWDIAARHADDEINQAPDRYDWEDDYNDLDDGVLTQDEYNQNEQ